MQKTHGFENILVAIDSSRPSQWAVQVAQRLALGLEARIMLVYVIEPLLDAGDGAIYSEEVQQIRQEQGRALLDKAAGSFPPGQKVETRLLRGDASQEITTIANDWPADLIVMGTRGNGRIAQLVLGSTANAVIRHASCPVISVAHECVTSPVVCKTSAGVN